MVAIFTGLGAGFERGSGASLGSRGLLGSSSFGRDGQGVFLNAATGNLLVNRQDEFLVGKGPDVAINRTYNSLGALDDNGDYWRQSTDRRIKDLYGAVNTDGGSIRRISADGSEITYIWTGSAYESIADPDAIDRLTYSTSTGEWTWTDGESRITERYAAYGTDNWRIVAQSDTDGNSLTFTYSSDKLARIETADGGFVDYVWTGGDITSIATGNTLTSGTLTRTSYGYDTSHRLIEVVTDLTPENTSDTRTYTTTYAYDGSSKRVASIRGTDDSLLQITYDTLGRVSQYAETVASGDVRITTIAYSSGQTDITDPRGQVTSLKYNWAGQLTQITAPPAETGGTPQVVKFEYTSPENLAGRGPGIVADGDQAYGPTPPWSIVETTVDGREAVAVSKASSYQQPWDGWSVPGSVKLLGGDRIDGTFSVTAGETVGYRLVVRAIEGTAYVVSKLVFLDANGAFVSDDSWCWNNAWTWMNNEGVAVVPTGAVSAYVDVSPVEWGVPSSTPMGFAYDKLQFVKLPTGATTIPVWEESGNLMRGGDLSLGAAVVQPGMDAPGGAPASWSAQMATVDSETALSITKDHGYVGGDGWINPGSVKLAGGDRPDGSFSASYNDLIAYRFDSHSLESSTTVVSALAFYDGGNNLLGIDAYSYNYNSGVWGENVNGAYAPWGTSYAVLLAWSSAYGTSAALPVGFAAKQIQVYKLPPDTPAVPTWDDTRVGRLSRITDAMGNKTVYSYDGQGNLASIIDANGNMTRRVYDSANHLVEEKRTGVANAGVANAYTRFVYDGEGHLRYAISGEGRVTEYRYTTPGQLEYTIAYTSPTQLYAPGVGVPTLSAMNAWRDGLSDRSSAQISKNVYDPRGNLLETFSYGAANASGVETTSQGYRHTHFEYDQAGRLLSRHIEGQQSETFVYDGLNRLTRSTDLNGGLTMIEFIDAETKTTIATAAGYTTVSTYNKAGELINQTDSGAATVGGTTTYLYDKNGQVRKTTDATGHASYFLYDKTGRKVADIGDGGELTEYRYDQNGRLIASIRYATKLTSTQLSSLADPNGEVAIASIRPSANSADLWQWSVYDVGGRVIETIAGDGSATRYQYDASDRLIATISYVNKLTSGVIAGFKSTLPTSLTTPSTSSADVLLRTFYDRDGLALGSLNGEGALTRIVYDAAGRKIQQIAYANLTDPTLRAAGSFDALLASITPDATRDVSLRSIYDGQGLLRFTIDALDHVNEIIYQDGVANDAIGLVRKTISYAAALGALSDYSYAAVKSAVVSLSGSNDRTAYSVYNDRGQLTYSVDALGAVTGFVYDTSGRVTKTTQFAVLTSMASMGTDAQWSANLDSWAASNGANARITRTYYTARGEVAATIDPEGFVSASDYDAEGRLYTLYRYPTAIAANDSWTLATIASANKGSAVATQYRYDALGRLSDVYDPHGVRTTTLYYANGEKQYDIVANGAGRDESRVLYQYDAAGRLIQKLSAADSANQVSETYQYDGLGNLVVSTDARNATTTFTYDRAGRVLTATNALGGITRHQYDAFGRAVVTIDARGAASSTFYDQGGRAVAAVDAESYVTRTAYTAFGEIASVTHYVNKESSLYQPQWIVGGAGYAISREMIDGSLSMVARNPSGTVPGWSSAAWGGDVHVFNGDRTDGQISVSAGDTINFSFDGEPLIAGVSIHAKATFTLANGSTVDDGWVFRSGSGWGQLSGNLTAPANAVAVHLIIYSYRDDGNTSGGFDFAVRNLSIRRNGVETMPTGVVVAANSADATTTFQYDKLGRCIQTTDAEGGVEQTQYNAFGQATASLNKLGGWTYKPMTSAVCWSPNSCRLRLIKPMARCRLQASQTTTNTMRAAIARR